MADQSEIEVEQFSPDHYILDLGGDELDAIEIVITVEEQLAFTIPDSEIDQRVRSPGEWKTLRVSDVIEIVESGRIQN